MTSTAVWRGPIVTQTSLSLAAAEEKRAADLGSPCPWSGTASIRRPPVFQTVVARFYDLGFLGNTYVYQGCWPRVTSR